MNTNNYDDEPTQYGSGKPSGGYDDEATQYDSGVTEKSNEEGTKLDSNKDEEDSEREESQANPKKNSGWGKVAAGAGAGILLGSAAALFTSFTPHPDSQEEQTPDWVDGKVPIAHGVNDDMEFQEAFDAARAEVGSGGVFEWHGYIYNTYTEDEWNNMSQAERDEFGSHFDWKGETPDNDDDVEVVGHEGGSTQDESVHSNTHSNNHEAHDTAEIDEQDVHVEQTGDDIGSHDGSNVDVTSQNENGDQEVEILGVTHDEESGMDIASATIDGHDAVIVDVNGDDVADVFGVDINNDHEFGTGEMVDISGENIHMSGLGGASTTTDDNLMAGTDVEPDYTDSVDDIGA